jgi:hypothetical protein
MGVLTACAAYGATVGEELVTRPHVDGAIGVGALYQRILPQGERLTSFAFYNGTPANLNYITPMLLELQGVNTWRVVGVGASVRNQGTGVQTHAFNLQSGSDQITSANFMFGWWNGRINAGAFTGNMGVIEFSGGTSNPGFRESCVAPNTGTCRIDPATGQLITYANVYAGPNNGTFFSGQGRIYSVTATTTPNPTTPGATVGESLLNRQYIDTVNGVGGLYQGVLRQGDRIATFSFFNDNPANQNYLTPMLLDGQGNGVWRVVGIGASVRNQGTGAQTFNFNLQSGSDVITGADFVFGWWNGRINAGAFTPNTGVIEFDATSSNPGARESCTVANIGPCSISPTIGQNITYSNVYAGPSTGALAAPNGRVYSVRVTTVSPQPALTGLRFVPVNPCRIADTREASLGATFGTPFMAAGSTRSFPIPERTACAIPAHALAYSLNATVVPREALGYLTVFPTGATQPFTSTLNSLEARVKANAALVPAGIGGAVSVYANNATELILDINGYFVDPAVNAQSLAFYPLAPCRVVDTRNAGGGAGALGGPALQPPTPRTFPVLAANCGIPANAAAYSFNATVVPGGSPLGFLTLWPAGQPQPVASTLNAPTGQHVANAAIVPAGTNGSINAFASGFVHLVLDINGYFAPPGAAGALRFFSMTPCRLIDSREAAGEFGGPILATNSARDYRLPLASCGLPNTASAYSLNLTVVPTTTLGYLTLWPQGQSQPFVSTLNAPDDRIVSNAALVGAGTGGAISIYVSNQTHLVVDTNGFFAP